MWSDLVYRVRALFRRRTVDRELDDELEFHLDRQAERFQQSGAAPDEARRRARAALGGLTQVKDACRDERGIGVIERLTQDLTYAARSFTKRPGFTVAVVLTFGLGIGATTTMFSVVDAVLLRPLPYPRADRLVQIGTTFGGVTVASVSVPDAIDVAARAKGLSSVAVARAVTVDLTGAGDPERLTGAAVSASFFDVLRVSPAIGQRLSSEHDRPGAPPVVVLSHRLWQRRFGAQAAAVGRVVSLDGVSHTVIGVMPPGFSGPAAIDQFETTLWLPLGRLGSVLRNRDDTTVSVIGRLADGFTLATAASDVDTIGQALVLEHAGRDGRRLWAASLHERTVGDSGQVLWLLFAAVGLLLLIACANVANLFLVRATERTHEIALRTALGAGRGRIARQLLTESAFFVVAGGALGVGLAFGGAALVRALGPTDLPRLTDVGVDLRVVSFAAGVSALASLVFGLVPALDAVRRSRTHGLRAFNASATEALARVRLRSALVVFQTSLAVVLIAGAGLLAQSLIRLSQVQPGFDAANVVWADITLPEHAYPGTARKLAFFDELLTRVRALPGVRAAGGIQGLPLGSGNSISSVAAEGRLPVDPDQAPRVPYHGAAPGYFDALGIARLDGRDFTRDDVAGGSRVAIVSRAFAARFWPNERAVGQRVWMGRVAIDAPLTTVIGVVDDVLQYGLSGPPPPIVYRPIAQVPRNRLSVVVRHDGRAPATVLDAIRQSVWTQDAALPLDRVGTMHEQVRASMAEPRFRAVALAGFAAVATLLAVIGLYGTLAWIVRARRREIGIRMVLGASGAGVLGLVLRRGMVLASIGIVVGMVGARAASGWLAGMVYGVTVTDGATFFAVGLGMALVSFMAALIPAWRASATDPVNVLRTE